jgi:hypothetical protein
VALIITWERIDREMGQFATEPLAAGSSDGRKKKAARELRAA